MLKRVEDFAEVLALPASERELVKDKAKIASERAGDMMHLTDYESLGALALHAKPGKIFEIGTYLGTTSDFLLQLLPDAEVVSIAYLNPKRWNIFGKKSNNSELKKTEVGSAVSQSHRDRFVQLYGDSHKLKPDEMVSRFGTFDFVLIDGDHSLAGVDLDTKLADKLLTRDGLICWHDANPKPKYMDVRLYLEQDMARMAIATPDSYYGGIAAWSSDIEKRLKSQD